MLKSQIDHSLFQNHGTAEFFTSGCVKKRKLHARTRRPATSRFPGALLYFATMASKHPPEPSPPAPRAVLSCQVQCFPTVNEKKRQSMKRKKSVESDSSDDVSAAAAACSSESAAAPAAARPAAEPAFLCAHPDCSGLPHRGCPGQSGLGSRRTQLKHVKEIHGGTPEAFVSCGVAPPRKKCQRRVIWMFDQYSIQANY